MKNVAFCYTTKDRVEYSQQTLPKVIAETDKFDLFLVDGSSTDAGRQFPLQYPQFPTVSNIIGGPDAAITYCLKMMYERGYDYCGLIENDVLLEDGWFAPMFDLFGKEEKVGAVSARCFRDRILDKRDGYAIMANIGAGMILLRREVIPLLFENYRRPFLWELQTIFKHYTYKDYPLPKQITEADPEGKGKWQFSVDWIWDAILVAHGYTSLALSPSKSINLDDPQGRRDAHG